MTLLIIIIIGCVLFFGGGILGWIIDIIGHILSFFFDGCMQTLGCLFWIILILMVLIVLGS